MKKWQDYADHLHQLFLGLCCTDARGAAMDPDDGFRLWRDWTMALSGERKTVYLIGNGASASMASHFAADLAKNARVHTEVFSDLSLITALANDMGYEHVFAEPLRRRAAAGDMLVAISSSGASPNILAAAEIAAELKMTLVTLTGKSAANPLRAMGQLNFYVPEDSYSLSESSHAAALHWWMDLVQLASAASPDTRVDQ